MQGRRLLDDGFAIATLQPGTYTHRVMAALRLRLPSLLSVAGALTLISGCASTSATTPAPDTVVAAVQVAGISQPLIVGAAGQVAATVTNAEGVTLTRSVAWSSSNAAVASVGTDGSVAALAAGTAAITATVDSKTGSLTVTVNNAAPLVAGISPASLPAGAAAQTLTVNGSGFVPTSVVRWNAADLVTTFASSARLTAQLPNTDVSSAGVTQVTVFTPGPGGGTSSAQLFTVSAAGANPVPAITTFVPASATSGGASFALIVNGTNFLASSTVNWNGTLRATTFVSASKLTAQISAADINAAGSAGVTVVNPAPGGGTSAAQAFAIGAAGVNPAPAIIAVGPTSAAAGSATFALTVTGTNFVSASTVRWNGSARATTFVSSTQLTAQITAADVAAVTTAAITVVSPAPGGGTSAAQAFAVFTSLPALTYAQLPPAYVASLDTGITADAQSAAVSITAPGLPVSGRASLTHATGRATAALRRAPGAQLRGGDCPIISPAQAAVNAAGLPLGVLTYTFTLANCTSDAQNSEEGVVILTDPTPGTSAFNYDIHANNIDVRLGDSTGTLELLTNAVDSVRAITATTVGEWLSATQEYTQTGDKFVHAVDTLTLHTTYSYSPSAGLLIYGTTMFPGPITIDQTTKWVIDPGNSFGISGTFTVVTTTLTPLQFDPSCQSDVQFTGGVLQSVVAGHTTTTTYHACNVKPTIQ